MLSTDPDDDVESLTHTNPDQPAADHRRVLVLLKGPAEGSTDFPLGVYDVTFEGGVVEATEGMGLAQLDVQDGEVSRQAANFTELELTHVGDGTICGELRAVGRSDDTSQPPTHVEGAFVASRSVDGSVPMRPEQLSRKMLRLRRRLGMDAANFDATLHALRHWAQTTLTEAGFDSRQIADRGGHTEALMKSVYIHRTDESEQKMTSHLGSLLDTPPRSQEG